MAKPIQYFKVISLQDLREKIKLKIEGYKNAYIVLTVFTHLNYSVIQRSHYGSVSISGSGAAKINK